MYVEFEMFTVVILPSLVWSDYSSESPRVSAILACGPLRSRFDILQGGEILRLNSCLAP